MIERNFFMNDRIFALDIGTRSVTGLILEKVNDTYTIIDYCMREHQERAMLDGQIHDVLKVSEVISNVKQNLEKQHGELNSVNVAAAGRALKTVQAQAQIPLHEQPITDQETIKHLELSAVQNALHKLIEENDEKSSSYYCVGYSVLYYKIDDQKIGSLIDQKGKYATVEVIATFLPQVVVESLLASLQRANLTMEALTLEPIAAIHVLIPESMRRLNVALIDIGAGTSDVAITSKGTITAYGMVSTAGDEITEAISDTYLLDFPKAEQAKKDIVNNGKAQIQDILGFDRTITYEDVIQNIRPTIERLADCLVEEIFKLNKQAPQAVMLIGGGSLTPEITSYIAKKLQLPNNRVAVRNMDAIQHVKKLEQLPQGPDFITPIGIAITSIENPIHYMNISINGQSIRLFELDKLTIGDCLIQSGINIQQLYGTPGLAYMIKVNGEDITLPGKLGDPPTILLNGKTATTEHRVQNGDELTVQKGADGKEPYVSIQELFDDLKPLTVDVNGKEHIFEAHFFVNGEKVDKKYILQDKDDVTINYPTTIKDILNRLNVIDKHENSSFPVYINGQVLQCNQDKPLCKHNGKEVSSSYPVQSGDKLTLSFTQEPMLRDLLKELNEPFEKEITVTFNQEKVRLKRTLITATRNGEEIFETTPIQPYDDIQITKKGDKPFIFQDVFRFVDFDLASIQGNYKLYINDREATFYQQIDDGDHLTIQ